MILGEAVVTDNQLLATIPKWGPSFKVSLELKIDSFDVPGMINGDNQFKILPL